MMVTSSSVEEDPYDLKDYFVINVFLHFTLIFHVDFSASTFTTSTAESSMLSSNANVGPRS